MLKWIPLIAVAGLLASCNLVESPATSAGLKVSDAMYCETGMGDYNPGAVWVTQQCPGCSGINGPLVADGDFLTFGSGTGATLAGDSIAVSVRPQEGVMFPGDGLSGFWFSRSMISSSSAGFRIEAYAGHKLVISKTFDEDFIIQALKHPSYFGINVGRHFDELRIVFDSDIEVNDIRVFEACLDHYPTYVSL